MFMSDIGNIIDDDEPDARSKAIALVRESKDSSQKFYIEDVISLINQDSYVWIGGQLGEHRVTKIEKTTVLTNRRPFYIGEIYRVKTKIHNEILDFSCQYVGPKNLNPERDAEIEKKLYL